MLRDNLRKLFGETRGKAFQNKRVAAFWTGEVENTRTLIPSENLAFLLKALYVNTCF